MDVLMRLRDNRPKESVSALCFILEDDDLKNNRPFIICAIDNLKTEFGVVLPDELLNIREREPEVSGSLVKEDLITEIVVEIRNSYRKQFSALLGNNLFQKAEITIAHWECDDPVFGVNFR